MTGIKLLWHRALVSPQGQQSGHSPAEPSLSSELESSDMEHPEVLSKRPLDRGAVPEPPSLHRTELLLCHTLTLGETHHFPGAVGGLPVLPCTIPPFPTQSSAPYLANMRRSSGFWAAGTLRIAARSCSERLASRFSVILLFSGESPLGSSSALELSILGLVRVMSSLLAVGWDRPAGFQCTKMGAPKALPASRAWDHCHILLLVPNCTICPHA